MHRDSAEMTQVVDVGGVTYKIMHPDPELAWKIGVELTQIVGESFAGMAQAAGDGDKVGEALPLAIRGMMQKIDPAKSLALAQSLFRYVEIQGTHKALIDQATFKVHFHGKMGSVLRLLGHCLEFQFQDFFAAMLDGIAAVMTKATEKKAA